MSRPPDLVVGGAGFIGSCVVDRLVEAGRRVRVLDSLHPLAHAARPEYLNRAAEYVWGDVRDPEIVRLAAEGAGSVLHQAAMVGLESGFEDAPAYVDHNCGGTAVLLAGLAETGFRGRLVLGASMVVYGEGRYRCPLHGLVRPGPRPRERLEAGQFEPLCPACGRELEPEAVPEDAPVDPRNVYAATKLHQEHLCSAFGRARGLPVFALRYHNVYGPRMPRDTPYAGVASIFRSALADGRPPRVFEDGAQRRDFVHVRDVAEANLRALEAPHEAAGTYNVASGTPRTVGEMAAALARAMDGPEPELTGEFRLGDVRHVFASAERTAASLGFQASVDFEDGVREFATAELRRPAELDARV